MNRRQFLKIVGNTLLIGLPVSDLVSRGTLQAPIENFLFGLGHGYADVFRADL